MSQRAFVGRTRELAALSKHYDTGRFELVVVYGRRRLGKTRLLLQFAQDKQCLFFTAQEKTDALNLRDFSDVAQRFFGLEGGSTFRTWIDALAFVANRAKSEPEPLLFVFDEFPFAAKANESLPAILQTAIDHTFNDIDMTMVLCGSNQGFMESEVLGSKSPLYGRRTAQMRLEPFDCFDARLMLPSCTPQQAVEYYATFGGTPYYLSQINPHMSYQDNVLDLFFNPYGLLYGEPEMLLRQELSEPSVYVSILDAVAGGATKPQVIADRSGVSPNSVGKYLRTLESLRIVERRVPFGENPNRSRKGNYYVSDPFFAYWYRFVSPFNGAIQAGAGEAAARQTAFGQALSTYVGGQFEDVSLQWVKRQNAQGKLGFIASSFGKWWGTDPVARERADIDVVAADANAEHMLLGECKWRNDFDESDALRTLEQRANVIAGSAARSYVLFTKESVSAGTQQKVGRRSDLRVVSANDMFDG